MSTTLTIESFTRYKECLRHAITDVMKATCGTCVVPQDDGGEIATHDVIIGVISLVGDAELSVFLGLPRGTAPALVAKFAGFEVPYESPDMGDAVGEVTNVLAGSMKNILDAKGIRVNISLPTVMRAENIQVLIQHGEHSVKTGFQTDLGLLWVGITAGKGGGFVA